MMNGQRVRRPIRRALVPTLWPVAGEGFDPADNSYYYELEPESPTELTLTVGRSNTESAATVGIVQVNNTENIFQIPESVSFEAG